MNDYEINEWNLDGRGVEEVCFECTYEAVEAAAGMGQYGVTALTLSFCSGLDTCPA
jgi:hypothetical protein